MEIKWNKRAIEQLLDIIEYLENNNLTDYASKIEFQILHKIESLPKKLEVFQIDRLKVNNNGSFYAFEISNYRISYRIYKNEIRILRIRYSGRRPFTR